MKNWWQQLQPRQQWVVAGGAIVVLIVVVWLAVWAPLQQARDQARAEVAQQQALAGWLAAVAPLAATLRNETGGLVVADGRSLLGVVDETARAAGLAAAIDRIEPAGEQRVRIWLNDAGFTTLMQWLEQIAAQRAIQIDELTAERSATAPGAVNVRITLRRDG